MTGPAKHLAAFLVAFAAFLPFGAQCADAVRIGKAVTSSFPFSGLELGKVEPTQVFINCVALTFHISKEWLMDDSNSDLGALTGSANMPPVIIGKYERLSAPYQRFIENQINELLLIQGDEK